jgi:hypothetical protein
VLIEKYRPIKSSLNLAHKIPEAFQKFIFKCPPFGSAPYYGVLIGIRVYNRKCGCSTLKAIDADRAITNRDSDRVTIKK